MELINLADLAEAEFSSLRAEVETHRSIPDIIEFLKRRGVASPIPVLVIQDEYSHDLTFALPGGPYLAYGTT